jgi:hypothetical protein
VDDNELLEEFVASFALVDELSLDEPPPEELSLGIDRQSDCYKWKPIRKNTDRSALVDLYRSIPGPFPLLYERLALNYRWLEILLGNDVRLLANPPGPALDGLRASLMADAILVETLYPKQLVPFGKAGDGYDPLCFDISAPRIDGDCTIMRVEHEAVLCEGQVGRTWLVYESFRELVNTRLRSVRGTARGTRGTGEEDRHNP